MPICAASYYDGGKCRRAGQELALNEFIDVYGKQLKLCRDCREKNRKRAIYFETPDEYEAHFEPSSPPTTKRTVYLRDCPDCGAETIITSSTARHRHRRCPECEIMFKTKIINHVEEFDGYTDTLEESATVMAGRRRRESAIAKLRWALLAIEDDKKREMALNALDRILENENSKRH